MRALMIKDKSPSGGDIPTLCDRRHGIASFTTTGDYDYYSSAGRDVNGRISVE